MTVVTIKVCGLTRAQDALLAVEAGAHYLGLIFVPNTPRCVSVAQASAIRDAVGENARVVGVFQNTPLAEMTQIADAVGLDLIQLHGAEPPEVALACPVPVIQVVTAGQVLPLGEALANTHAILLDLPKGDVAAQWQQGMFPSPNARPLSTWLAGKLTPDTVGPWLDMFQPDGVDVASGVESAPGVKDPQKLLAFCRAVGHYKTQHPQHKIGLNTGESA